MITAICLILDKRIDLFRRLNQEAYDCDIKMIPFICGDGSDPTLQYNWIDIDVPSDINWGYSAAGHVKNHYNAFRCHQEMAKIGLQVLQNDPHQNILFLEDDSKILVDRFQHNKSSINCPCHKRKDILYLGYWTGRENDLLIEERYKDMFVLEQLFTPIGGLHGAILRKRALEAIIRMEPNDPVDAQLNRNASLTRFLVKPKMITTINTYSFTEGINIERDYI